MGRGQIQAVWDPFDGQAAANLLISLRWQVMIRHLTLPLPCPRHWTLGSCEIY